MRLCRTCGQSKPLADFYASTRNHRCKACAKARVKQWYETNRQRKLEVVAAWKTNNKRRQREYQRTWDQKNSDYHRHRVARRRSRQQQAMPQWLAPSANRCLYAMAERVSRCLGVPYEVDHRVPLRGKTVCGLHVPWNLVVIPRWLNALKSNRLV